MVCAACRFADGTVVLGPRHFDDTMHAVIGKLGLGNRYYCGGAEQGFVDQWGRFMSRQEAFSVASEMKQLLAEPSVEGTLFSEDLY